MNVSLWLQGLAIAARQPTALYLPFPITQIRRHLHGVLELACLALCNLPPIVHVVQQDIVIRDSLRDDVIQVWYHDPAYIVGYLPS